MSTLTGGTGLTGRPSATLDALKSIPILAALAAVLLVLPGVNAEHFPPWTSFHSEAPAFAASAVLLVAAIGYRGQLRITPALGLLIALVLSAWIQVATGLVTYAGDAWVATAYLGALAAAWIWGYGAAKSGQAGQPLLLVGAALVVLGLFTCFQALVQWLGIFDSYSAWVFSGAVKRPTGNFGQPNQSATLLLMATAAVAVFTVQGRLSRPVTWLLVLVFGWVLVTTQSRTALLSATVLGAIALVLASRSTELKRYRADIVCWLAFLFAGAWLLQVMPWDFMVAPRKAEDLAQTGNRLVIWQQVLAGLLQSPWVGHGWAQVATAQQAGALAVTGADQVNYAHNVLLDLAVFIGVPGALLVAALALGWLVKRLRPGPAAAGLFVLAPLAVHMQLELPHAYAYFLVPAGMLLGAFDAQTEPARRAGWRLPRWALAGAAILWTALLAAMGYEYALAEEDFRVNRFENRRLGQTPAGYAAPELRLLTQLGEIAQAMRLRAQPDMRPQDLDVLERATRRYTWAALHYRAALAMGLNERPEQAAHHLLLIKQMFKHDIYEEGRKDWIRMGDEQYPQLRAVELP